MKNIELPLNQILCGDCAELLQPFPDNSIDLVATDPPYGLGFMGKEWDRALPSREAFKQIIRVLKPGALAFVMSSPRQDLMWRMCALLEGVGFEMRQSFLSWIYKTGFPKAYDVSKGIDKKLGLEREIIDKIISNGGRSGKTESVGQYLIDMGKEIEITEPVSDEAKLWDGWKSQTGLKPALEPILMVNKPFSEGTIVDNVLRWGTGAINVDATRIPLDDNIDPRMIKGWSEGQDSLGHSQNLYKGGYKEGYIPQSSPLGRFPANLLVSDGALDTGEQSKSGVFGSHHKIAQDENGMAIRNVYGEYRHVAAENQISYGDQGDQSRYFDLDAWAKHHGFLDVPKPDTKERDYGLKGRNTHPTVKPIKLMAYLIELGCPRNGVVLDPFVGSGTTCIAAKRSGRHFIGIEINKEDYDTAVARVAAYPQPLEWFQET